MNRSELLWPPRKKFFFFWTINSVGIKVKYKQIFDCWLNGEIHFFVIFAKLKRTLIIINIIQTVKNCKNIKRMVFAWNHDIIFSKSRETIRIEMTANFQRFLGKLNRFHIKPILFIFLRFYRVASFALQSVNDIPYMQNIHFKSSLIWNILTENWAWLYLSAAVYFQVF